MVCMATTDEHEVVVATLEQCVVVPKMATHRHELFLSSLDLFWVPCDYVRTVHFYATEEQDAFISTLRESLGRVLVPFYPAAGRLTHDAERRICIDCNDAGVEFIIAKLAGNVDFLQLQARNFPLCPLFDKLAAAYEVHHPSDVFNWPLLSVQVTKFPSGQGVAVGYAQSHVLADGEAWCHFFRSWAECARNVSISLSPLHTRTSLAIQRPSLEIALPPYKMPTMHKEHASMCIDKERPIELAQTYIPFNGELIQKLKQEANANPQEVLDTAFPCHQYEIKSWMMGGGQKYSSYEAVGAYWWKHITKARRLEGEEIVAFIVLKNMRRRVKSASALPTAYFGNATVVGVVAYATASEVLKESLASTAARIRHVSHACNEEYMWARLHWLELNEHALPKFEHPYVKLVSSPHLPFDDVDYGYGRAVAFTPAKLTGDGRIMLSSSRDGNKGGVDYYAALSTQATDNLLKDSSFACSNQSPVISIFHS